MNPRLFVSYTFMVGSDKYLGSCQIMYSKPVASFDDIKAISKIITDDLTEHKHVNISISNWKRFEE